MNDYSLPSSTVKSRSCQGPYSLTASISFSGDMFLFRKKQLPSEVKFIFFCILKREHIIAYLMRAFSIALIQAEGFPLSFHGFLDLGFLTADSLSKLFTGCPFRFSRILEPFDDTRADFLCDGDQKAEVSAVYLFQFRDCFRRCLLNLRRRKKKS